MEKPLYKTTVIIWSEYDPSSISVSDLARDSVSGESYCSSRGSVLVEDPQEDGDWDNTEFFDIND